MPFVKVFKYFSSVCVLALSVNNVFSETGSSVRVLVLNKYKPTKIIISHKYNSLNNITIDQNSTLPLQINSFHDYKIFLPDSEIKRSYTGTISIYKGDKYLRIINTVPIEEYVKSVVLSEIGIQHQEAMRAQAILARTWAIKHLRPLESYDFNDLTNSQVYKGILPGIKIKPSLITPTYNQILTYNKNLIKVFYHSDCATRSYSAYEIWGVRHYPYYKRINFPRELKSSQSKQWVRRINQDEINKIFQDVIKINMPVKYKKTIEQGRLGITINEHWIDIDTFRLKINRVLGWNQLRSNHFSLNQKDGFIIFKGAGFGHLVGLCQKSAIKLANKGWKYPEILELFYPGTIISRIK